MSSEESWVFSIHKKPGNMHFSFKYRALLYSAGKLGTHYVEQAALNLTEILYLSGIGIIGLHYHTWLTMSLKKNILFN